MTTPVFNDLLFASLEAQNEFQAYEATLPVHEAQRLRSVMGKPSQFVGRVMSLSQALDHWQKWEEWDRTQGAELRNEAPPSPAAKRGRPLSARTIAINAARDAWKAACEQEEEALKQIAEWERLETRRIHKQANEGRAQWAEYVRGMRDLHRAAKQQ